MTKHPKLTKTEVDRILKLLDEGQTKTEVAGQFGISQTAINSILDGRHPLSPFREKKPKAVSTYQRCPSCGAKVLAPCMACAMTRGERIEEFPRVVIAGDGRGYG